MDAASAYRESTVRSASGVRLVIFLYEQAVRDLRRALEAMKQADIEVRTRHINHAITVIGHLQATLDRDRGAGVSRDLDTFYNRLRARLMEAQVKISAAILTEEIEELLSVREAWLEVERTSSQGGTLPASESGVPADQFMKAASDEQV